MNAGVTHQNGLYPEALPERGVFFVVVFSLPEYKRVGGSLKWKDMKQYRNLSLRLKRT